MSPPEENDPEKPHKALRFFKPPGFNRENQTDIECRDAFLEGAGVSDREKFQRMGTLATMFVLIKQSGITLEELAEGMGVRPSKDNSG